MRKLPEIPPVRLTRLDVVLYCSFIDRRPFADLQEALTAETGFDWPIDFAKYPWMDPVHPLYELSGRLGRLYRKGMSMLRPTDLYEHCSRSAAKYEKTLRFLVRSIEEAEQTGKRYEAETRRQSRQNKTPSKPKASTRPLRDAVHSRTVWLWGTPYRLRVQNEKGPAGITLEGDVMVMNTRSTTHEGRQKILDRYRIEQTEAALTEMMPAWHQKIGVQAEGVLVKSMSGAWGRCYLQTREVMFHPSLSKHPKAHLEHIIVHELVHLHEPKHSKRFHGLMAGFMPDYKQRFADTTEFAAAMKKNEASNAKFKAANSG